MGHPNSNSNTYKVIVFAKHIFMWQSYSFPMFRVLALRNGMAKHSLNAIGGNTLILYSDIGLLKKIVFLFDHTLCLSSGNCMGSLNCSGSLTARGQELVPGSSRASVGETKNSTKVDHGPVVKTVK